ncbi:MAG: hypothetical protein AAFR16_09240 [Pseudomonadota bacterium]
MSWSAAALVRAAALGLATAPLLAGPAAAEPVTAEIFVEFEYQGFGDKECRLVWRSKTLALKIVDAPLDCGDGARLTLVTDASGRLIRGVAEREFAEAKLGGRDWGYFGFPIGGNDQGELRRVDVDVRFKTPGS